jgi:P-type Ca2+ transporter type 2C
VLGVYLYAVACYGSGSRASTVAFLTVVLVQPLQAMHCRSAHVAVWRLASNRLLAVSLVALSLIQWAAVSWQPLAALLGTVPLSGADWLVSAVGILCPVLVLEILKTRQRARAPRGVGQSGRMASVREALSRCDRRE